MLRTSSTLTPCSMSRLAIGPLSVRLRVTCWKSAYFTFTVTVQKNGTVLVNGAVLTEGPPRQIADDPQVRAVYLGETEVTHDGH